MKSCLLAVALILAAVFVPGLRPAASSTAAASVFQARIVTATSPADHLYLIGHDGNEIAWAGNVAHVPTGWTANVNNVGLAPNTAYYVYVVAIAGVPAIELSTTGHSPDAWGNEVKQTDGSRLLAGMVYTNPAGLFWRDAQHAYVLNWFNRMPIFVAPPAGPATVSGAAWQELGAVSLNQMGLLTWGYAGGQAESLVMGMNGSATLSVDGARLDLVFGDLALGPNVPVSSWIVVTPAKAWQWQNASGASTIGFAEGRHVLTFWGRTDGIATADVRVNLYAETSG